MVAKQSLQKNRCSRPSHGSQGNVRDHLKLCARRSGQAWRYLRAAVSYYAACPVPLCPMVGSACTPATLQRQPTLIHQACDRILGKGLQDVGGLSTGHQRTSSCHAGRVLAALWAGTGVHRFSPGQDRKFRVSLQTSKSTLRRPRTL